MTQKLRSLSVPVVAGVIAVLATAASGCTTRASAKPRPSAEPAITVQKTRATRREVPRVLRVTGNLTANRESDVAATSSGRVQQVSAERGAVVTAGALLARLDAREASIQRAEAEAHLQAARVAEESAELDCSRAESLLGSQVISQAEYDRTRAACSSAVFTRDASIARKRLAERALGDSVVRAPFAGLVAERFVDEGEFVAPGRVVARVVEIDPLRLELSVPESAAAAVRAGSAARFTVAAFPGERFSAEVRYVGPTVRRAGRDFLVEAVVENSAARLRPGMFATAELTLGTESALTLPRDAVSGTASSPRVFVVNAGRAEERVVQLGEEHDGQVVVQRGLGAGDEVILAHADVKDGALVK